MDHGRSLLVVLLPRLSSWRCAFDSGLSLTSISAMCSTDFYLDRLAAAHLQAHERAAFAISIALMCCSPFPCGLPLLWSFACLSSILCLAVWPNPETTLVGISAAEVAIAAWCFPFISPARQKAPPPRR